MSLYLEIVYYVYANLYQMQVRFSRTVLNLSNTLSFGKYYTYCVYGIYVQHLYMWIQWNNLEYKSKQKLTQIYLRIKRFMLKSNVYTW